MDDIRRGEIFYIARGGATNGSEQFADRPAVVVSNDENNKHSGVIEVVYMTTQPKTDLPTHVTVRSTGRLSTVLCEQVSSVSTDRVNNYIGQVSEQEMKNIDIALMISLQLSGGGKTSKQYNETIQKQQEEIEYYRNKIQAMQQSLEEKKTEKPQEVAVINPKENFNAKFDYYMAAYDDEFEDIQSQLIDEKASSGWKEQIADAVDRVVDKMLKETPPETEEERQNCETMRETIKGMFLTQRRSKTEAAFITENIDRYEELFEICMNGDDAQFKKGITELQKAQNEYILQKERGNG